MRAHVVFLDYIDNTNTRTRVKFISYKRKVLSIVLFGFPALYLWDVTTKRTITDNHFIALFLRNDNNAVTKFQVGQYFFVYPFVWGK